MHNDQVKSGVISKAVYTKLISCSDHDSIIESERYYVSIGKKEIGSYENSELFPDKESLINSL